MGDVPEFDARYPPVLVQLERLSKHLRGVDRLRERAVARLAPEVFGKAFDAVDRLG